MPPVDHQAEGGQGYALGLFFITCPEQEYLNRKVDSHHHSPSQRLIERNALGAIADKRIRQIQSNL